MKKVKKSLQDRFLEGEKLNILDELTIKTLQRITDCDGTCSLCGGWYCESKRASYKPVNYNQ